MLKRQEQMDKFKNYVIIGLIAVIGILLLLKQCTPTPNKEVFLKGKDSVYVRSIPAPYKVVEFKTKWYPMWDTIKLADSTFNKDLCKFERTYNDSTVNDSITIYSNLETIGVLKSQKLSYRWKVPSVVKETYRIDTLVRPSKWQFLAYTEVGGNLDKFNMSVGGDFIFKKAEIGYRYGILDKTHNLKVGYRILKSRK